MSIDARVDRVVVNQDGSGELRLRDRPAKDRRTPGIAGQALLYFTKAPDDVALLEGRDIWGGANEIILGDTTIAERDGYTSIKFTVDSIAGVVK